MKEQWKAYTALAILCVVWGTTYLAIRIGVHDIPPFLFSGIRQTIAGGVMCAFFLLKGKRFPIWAELKYHILAGFTLIFVGNGFVGWGETTVPSGVTALICSMMPIWVILLNVIVQKNSEKTNAMVSAGVILGFSGLVVIFRNALVNLTNPAYTLGIVIILVATFSWAAGTLIVKKRKSSINPAFAGGIQLLSGGLMMFTVSPFTENYSQVNFSQDAVWSLIYLIVVGSMVSYTALNYMLEHLPATTASIYAYINPFVALIAGWWILDEMLTGDILIAGALTISGVYLVTRGKRKRLEQPNLKVPAGKKETEQY